jgi:mannose-6-phosphate isomerase-like protein (cupin superfamily)
LPSGTIDISDSSNKAEAGWERTMTFIKAYGVENTEGEVLNMLGTDIRVLAGRRTGSSFSLMTCRLPPGQGPPPHIHDDEDEAFYVLDGQMRFKPALTNGCLALVASFTCRGG